MILSIRHRILLPFLFITIFMAFASLYIAIELIQGYFNHQIHQVATRYYLPIESKVHQLAAQAAIEQRQETATLTKVTEYLDQYPQFQASIQNQQILFSNANEPRAFPIQFPTFTPQLASLYIKKGTTYHRVYHSTQRPLALDSELNPDSYAAIMRQAFIDKKQNGEWVRSYFYEHPTIKNLMVHMAIPCTNLVQKKQLTLVIVMGIILGVNTFIFLIFSFILKRITWSLSKITESAKQLSKGRRTAPLTVHSNDELGLLAQSFNHMLNNVQTKTAELIYERNRSKMILAQLPEGIIVTDLNNKLLSANRAAEMMLGFSTDRARGQELISYLKNENLSSFFNHEVPQINDTALVRELIISNEYGADDHYQITVSPLLDTTYQKTGMITVIRNITQEKKSRLIKENFLRSVTHELRIPLTSVIGFLTILGKESHGSLNDTQHDFLNIATINANYLKKLINDLLELSIIQSGDVNLASDTIQLAPFIDTILADIQPFIDKKMNNVSITIAPSLTHLLADSEKLTIILKNVMLNANKSTQNGQILCKFQTDDTGLCAIIKDDGPGLSEELKQQFLTAFDPSHDPLAIHGLGLELAIVKELVHQHGGHISIESQPNEGTTFSIHIPQQPMISDHHPHPMPLAINTPR